jgi:hypothetical protein
VDFELYRIGSKRPRCFCMVAGGSFEMVGEGVQDAAQRC